MPLHLLPNTLDPDLDHTLFLPRNVDEVVHSLDGIFAESDKGGRLFLKHFKKHLPIQLLNEHTKSGDLDFLLEPVKKGESWGVVSDCGLPCMADPGSRLVMRAQQLQIPTFAYPGPSAITQSLMLSGLPSQRFHFHGYIAKSPEQRQKELKKWESETGVTHVFIEAPYRNAYAFQSCLESLNDKTLLCIGWDLTLPTQGIFTAPLSFWRRNPPPPLEKIPAIFLFYRNDNLNDLT